MATETGAHGRQNGAEPRTLRFGVFEMDLRSGELRRQGALVRLQPQPFKVLALLASRAGEVVTREEIQAEVWPAGTFVDFEQSLNFCIRQIRTALGDQAVTPRFVETLPKRGYRWIGGPVEMLPTSAAVYEWPQPPAGETSTASARTPRDERVRRRWWMASAGLTAATLVALSAWLALRSRPTEGPPTFQRLTFHRGSVNSGRFAPDGQVVFGASWEGRPPTVHVARVDPPDSRVLELEGCRVVGLSASGEVATLRQRLLSRAPLAGGPPKDVLRDVTAADWTDDGSTFAVARASQGRYRIEYPIGRVLGETGRVSALRLAPDGRRLAFVEHPVAGDDRGAVVLLERDGKRTVLSEGWSSLEGLAWSARGDEVWFTATPAGADCALHATSLDGRVRTVLASMGRLVLHDIAADGRVLLERATVRAQILFGRFGGTEERELSWLDFSTVEQLSADGSRLLLLESGEGGGADYATFLRPTDGSSPIRLGPGRASGLSPDGQWVLTIPIRRPDHVDLVPVGPGEARELRVPGAAAHEMAGFLPDGKGIFVTTRDTAARRRTWLLDVAGGQARPLPLPENRALLDNTFSPDGRQVVVSCPDSEAPCLYPVAGGGPRPLPGARPDWVAMGWDRRGRVYLLDRSMRLPAVLRRLDPRTGRLEVVAELGPRDRAGVTAIHRVVVAGDGQSFAYSYFRRLSDLYVVAGLR